MSDNTVEAYLHDVSLLSEFMHASYESVKITDIELKHLQAFVMHINDFDFAVGTQARVLSGIKSFFRFSSHSFLRMYSSCGIHILFSIIVCFNMYF